MSHDTTVKKKKAVLVGLQLPRMSSQELEQSLQELARLVTTLGHLVVGSVTQKRDSEKSPHVLGDGKLLELSKWTGGSGKVASLVEHKKSKAALKWEEKSEEDTLEHEEIDPNNILTENKVPEITDKADIVIVDCDLSPNQLRNLESATGAIVLDRTGVIIEIFSRHAKTKAARLQVEIARLTYVAPRVRESKVSSDQQGGGGKGSGETSLELDKRKIRDRIKELKNELESIGDEHEVRRAKRVQENTVALVGYTNAGKSSLMRALTGSDILVADKLFATLDTTIRPLQPESTPRVLISDTVGFIKKLPHDLVASFKSTLDEALHAKLLLYVVDCSDVSFESQLAVTKTVLSEVGAHETESFLVLNKRDQLTEHEQQNLKEKFPDSILISTRDNSDLTLLREKILSYFESDMIDTDFFIPYIDQQKIIGELRLKVRVLSESYDELGLHLKIRTTPEILDQFKKQITPQRRR